MKPRRNRKKTLGQFMTLVVLFLCAGFLLFLHAWLPVQAQRKLKDLEGWQKTVSQEKTLLRILKKQYFEKTSLPLLDKWAKSNGPWRSPRAHEVLLINE